MTTMKKTLKIEGMSCMHCVKAVTEAISAVNGVEAVKVDLESGTAAVEASGAVTDDMLLAAVEGAGYGII